MSGRAGKIKQKIVEHKVETFAEILTIMESTARKKNFFQRVAIGFDYIFRKKFTGFFK